MKTFSHKVAEFVSSSKRGAIIKDTIKIIC